MLNINLEDAKDPFAPADRGRYTCTITKLEDGHSKAARDRMLTITYEINGGPTDDFNGKEVKDFVMLEGKGTPNGHFRLKQMCEATGFPLDGSFELTAFVGQTVDCELTVSDGDGDYGPSNRISSIYAT